MTSATSAYREDARRNGGPFGANDDAWIIAVTIAERAAAAEGERRAALLAEAAAEAARILGEPTRERLAFREWNAPGTPVGTITLLSVHLQELGAMALATCLVDAGLRALGDDDTLERGRMLAQRARMSYHAAEYDAAEDLYAQVDRIGRAIGSVELRARSAHGFVGMAQVRGNYPLHLEHATRALRLSDEAGIPQLQRTARYSLMRNAAARQAWEEALGFAWELVELARGDHVEEGKALQSIGMLMLEMGDRVTARSAFCAVVALPLPPRIHLAALGGLALTTAGHADERKTLEWAVGEVLRLRESVVSRFSYTHSLLECAIALRAAGEHERSAQLRDEVVALARRHGYNELLYRADELEDIGELADRVQARPASPSDDDPAFSAGRSGEIVRSIRRMEPARLPRHVQLVTASAG